MPDMKRSFIALDGLRGIAALVVVLHHSGYFFGYVVPEGYLAVDFFYVLSGFVLAHAYGHQLTHGMTARRFMAIRLIRFYPLYLLAFTAWLPIGWAELVHGHVDPRMLAIDVATALLFLPSPLSTDPYPINAPTGTLFYELLVNAGLGLFARRLSNTVLVVLIVAAGLVLLTCAIVNGDLSDGNLWRTFFVGCARVAFSFPAGILVYRIWLARKLPVNAPVALVAVALLMVLAARPPQSYQGLFDAVACVVVFPTLIWIGASSKPRPAAAEICKWLGAISYAVYVLHFPMLTLAIKLAQRHSGLNVWPIGAVFVALVVVAAHLADRFYDGPVRRKLGAMLQRSEGLTMDRLIGAVRFAYGRAPAPNETAWHEWNALCWPVRTVDGELTLGRVWRRRNGALWEYRERPDRPNDRLDRAY